MAHAELLKGVGAAGRIYILFIVLYALAIGSLMAYLIVVNADAV